MSLLTAKDLRLAPWGRTVLHAVSLSIDAGEVLVVAGPNGAGKSTLLQALTGSLRLEEGEIQLMGRELPGWERRERARVLAVLSQRSSLNFPFLVEDVVQLGRIPHVTGSELDRVVSHEAMQSLDIGHLAQRPYTALSGGEQQRVQLARVLTQLWRAEDSPGRVLLLDEPATALDYAYLGLLRDRLRDFAGQGCGVLVVVHDLNFAIALADRVILLAEGRVAAEGPAEVVFTEQHLQEAFGVSPLLSVHPQTGRPLVIQQ